MDIQFVLDEYAVASYVINYVSKVEGGMSKMLREAVKDTRENKNMDHRARMRHISNVLSNGALMSAQEAAYMNLSLPLVRNSRSTIFINTNPIDERVRMTKLEADLEELADDDTEIVMKNLSEKYADRPQSLENKCLAEFAACYNEKKNVEGHIEYKERQCKPRYIRYVRYRLDGEEADEANYYREQCLFILPMAE